MGRFVNDPLGQPYSGEYELPSISQKDIVRTASGTRGCRSATGLPRDACCLFLAEKAKGATMPTPSLSHDLASVTARLLRCETTPVKRARRKSTGNEADTVWLDLTLLNQTAVTQVLERYALPLEVTTYFQLKFQSPKVITTDRALFVVTCIVSPSPRFLFLPHELKLCITPTLVAGLYDRSGRTQPQVASVFARPIAGSAERITEYVWDILDGVVGSYETVVQALPTHVLTRKETADHHWWKKRGAALAELLHQHHVCMHNVVHAGRKVGLDDLAAVCEQWDARIDQMLRRINDTMLLRQDSQTSVYLSEPVTRRIL